MKAKNRQTGGTKYFSQLLDELERAISLESDSLINEIYDKLETVDNTNIPFDFYRRYDMLVHQANRILINYLPSNNKY